jgi:hypothetical protein
MRNFLVRFPEKMVALDGGYVSTERIGLFIIGIEVK